MDVFKQNRFLTVAIIILVVLNFSSLTMLFVGRPRPPKEGSERIVVLLQKELGFNDVQVSQYIRMRHVLQEKAARAEMRIRAVKKQMFDQALQENAPENLSDSLLTIIQREQAGVEMVTYQHIRALKEICRPAQRAKLGYMIHNLLGGGLPGRGGPPPEFDHGRPPPPPPPR